MDRQLMNLMGCAVILGFFVYLAIYIIAIKFLWPEDKSWKRLHDEKDK